MFGKVSYAKLKGCILWMILARTGLSGHDAVDGSSTGT
jgi:hypothetical protein